MKIRILLVDDHAVVREGLQRLIATDPGLEVIGEASNGVEGVHKALTLRPDVVIMDMIMPQKNGVEAIREIKAGNADARILVLTSFPDEEQLFPALEAGASGYLLKDALPDELLNAIRVVHTGESFLQPVIAQKVLSRLNARQANPPKTFDALTEREKDVLKLLARGMGDREIAKELVISERTVNSHVRNILDKLCLENRTQAALFALQKIHDLSDKT
ncbi:MAG TPA: response regulator transcription factor [Anaerolineales bacterium]|nr:response regulator transcription factor [Anaerolineales bacterium]